MFYEMTVHAPTQDHKVFLQNGFYHGVRTDTLFHKHNYAEIHFFSGGNVCFNIDSGKFEVGNGKILIIPKALYHSCDSQDKGILHAAFQIDYDVPDVSVHKISSGILSSFFDAINRCINTKDHTEVAAYITLICHLISNQGTMASPITDPGFIIQEFFSHNYSQKVHLRDLASKLHLSERQTERLVIQHTGKTFNQELIDTRIKMANYLMKNTSMSLTEIAEYVGYSSYAGFWKALKNREQE